MGLMLLVPSRRRTQVSHPEQPSRNLNAVTLKPELLINLNLKLSELHLPCWASGQMSEALPSFSLSTSGLWQASWMVA